MLRFYNNTDVGLVARRLAEDIRSKLSRGQDVFWLLSGGSAISVAVGVAHQLANEDLSRLTVGLIDERYGVPTHAYSNWQQLKINGLELEGATQEPVNIGLSFNDTASKYDEFIASIAGKNIYKIGLLGMGADGHTAGILPHSSVINSEKYVDCYEADDYNRITLTGKGLRILDKAVVYAAGSAKKTAIERLTKTLPASEQPVQLLKRVADVDVYNDVIGDSI